jgi:inorganic pyrophosphatase
MHPWRDVDLGAEAPEVFNAVIEIPLGSTVKYELDRKTGLLRVDRVLHSAVYYPANYGFLPRTWRSGNDPLNALALGQAVERFLCRIDACHIIDRGRSLYAEKWAPEKSFMK